MWIGEMLKAALHGSGIEIVHLCVTETSYSGRLDELLEVHGMGSKHIVEEVLVRAEIIVHLALIRQFFQWIGFSKGIQILS